MAGDPPMSPSPELLSRLADVAQDAAESAGALLLTRFRTTATGVSAKSSSTDLVSDADRDAERLILDLLRGERPDDTILGEEGGTVDRGTRGAPAPGEGPPVHWVVDPLDGTVNFLYGIPMWGVSVAAEVGGRAVAAVVHHPALAETFRAVRGAGATCNGTTLSVTQKTDPATALVGTGFAYDRRARSAQGSLAARLVSTFRDLRRGGSAALDLAWLAAGRLDGFYEAPLGPWDYAAGSLLISEAGGVVRPLEVPWDTERGVIAAGPGLIDSLDELVRVPLAAAWEAPPT